MSRRASVPVAARIGMGVIALLAVAAIFAPWIAPHDPGAQNLTRRFEGPGSDFWLGTDDFGRDTLSRAIFGARVSLQAVVQALLLAAAIGLPVGLIAGYRGGWPDRILMRLVDVIFSLPGIAVAFTSIALLGPGLTPAMIGIGVVFSTRYIRLVRGLVLAAREEQYVDAAVVGGAPSWRIMAREILPNVSGPLIVQTAVFAGAVIIIEATLSFFGLGVPVNEPSWGGMLNQARTLQFESAWLPIVPGIAITVTVLAFNVVGDSIRDVSGGRVGHHHLSPRASADVATSSADTPTSATAQDREPTTDVGPASVLRVTDLSIVVDTAREVTPIVTEVSFDLAPGRTLALVGESGSGKTMTALAVMGLLPPVARVSKGSIQLGGVELAHADEARLRRLRANDMAMIFQEPKAALNPALTIGHQVSEPIRVSHPDLDRRQRRERTIELLADVGIGDPHRIVDEHPHRLSGGMAQRVMIAMALANEPSLLIADEPTTALDVTIQGQIVDLLHRVQRERDLAMVFITHDLALVADVAQHCAVMQQGRIIETGDIDTVFASPSHDYTQMLLKARNHTSLASTERLSI